jgi:carboxyl-terminal processing protease
MDSLARGKNAQKMPNIGAYFRQIPKGFVVQMVTEGSPAQRADLRKGDVVQSADGAPFRPVASFAQATSVDLTISRAGQTYQKQVKPDNDSASDMFLEATEDSVRVIPDNGRKIGYVHLWTLAGTAFREALEGAVYGKLVNTDACILDLRDGFGGRPEGYADPFFRPEMAIDWIYADSQTHEQFGYQRPLIVLINGGSRSAKEILSLILKKSRRATLVGSRTAGNVLGTFPLRISDWAYLEIPMVDVIADGFRLEGKGVEPDVAVPQEFDASGKDLYMETALGLLGNVKVRVQSFPGKFGRVAAG